MLRQAVEEHPQLPSAIPSATRIEVGEDGRLHLGRIAGEQRVEGLKVLKVLQELLEQDLQEEPIIHLRA